MNAHTGTGSEDSGIGGTQARRRFRAALAAVPLLAAVAVPGHAAEQSIVASINPPAPGLSCADAAAATSVYFQFANPPFQVTQLSLYVDGKGAPQDAIDEHWPTVTLSKGLHPGRNTVDVVANGGSGQRLERRLVVLVGTAPEAGDSYPAVVSCNDAAAAQAAAAAAPADQTPPSVVGGDLQPVVVEGAPPPVAYDTPPPVVVYPAPVYVYNPYPVVALDPWAPLLPFFSFGFFYSNFHPYCPAPAVVYNHYYGGPGGGPGWHGGGPGGWGGGPGGGPGPYPAPHAPAAGGPQGGAQPAGAARSAGGWQGNGPAAAQSARGGYGSYHTAYNAPAQTYRPAAQPQYRAASQSQYRAAPQFQPRAAPAFQGGSRSAAPAFHGGGGHGFFRR